MTEKEILEILKRKQNIATAYLKNMEVKLKGYKKEIQSNLVTVSIEIEYIKVIRLIKQEIHDTQKQIDEISWLINNTRHKPTTFLKYRKSYCNLLNYHEDRLKMKEEQDIYTNKEQK